MPRVFSSLSLTFLSFCFRHVNGTFNYTQLRNPSYEKCVLVPSILGRVYHKLDASVSNAQLRFSARVLHLRGGEGMASQQVDTAVKGILLKQENKSKQPNPERQYPRLHLCVGLQ